MVVMAPCASRSGMACILAAADARHIYRPAAFLHRCRTWWHIAPNPWAAYAANIRAVGVFWPAEWSWCLSTDAFTTSACLPVTLGSGRDPWRRPSKWYAMPRQYHRHLYQPFSPALWWRWVFLAGLAGAGTFATRCGGCWGFSRSCFRSRGPWACSSAADWQRKRGRLTLPLFFSYGSLTDGSGTATAVTWLVVIFAHPRPL